MSTQVEAFIAARKAAEPRAELALQAISSRNTRARPRYSAGIRGLSRVASMPGKKVYPTFTPPPARQAARPRVAAPARRGTPRARYAPAH